MGNRKSKLYFSTLLAAFLFIAPNLSWATFNLLRDAQDPTYQSGLQSFKSKNYQAAYNTWLPLARNGNSKAQYYIGYMYLNGLHVKQDAVEARKWFERAAGQGDANAQNDLGSLFLNGQGVQRNLDTALKWFQLSANQGNATAQYNMGVVYSMKNMFNKAKVWFEASAMQGYAKANYRLKELFNLDNLKLPRIPGIRDLFCNTGNGPTLLPPPADRCLPYR